MLLFVDKGRYIWVILLSILLSQIHLSAIFFVLLLPLRWMPINRILIALTVPLAILFHFYLGDYFNNIGSGLGIRQSHYFEIDDGAKSLTNLEVVRRIALVGLLFILYHYSIFKTNLHKLVLKCILLSVF